MATSTLGWSPGVRMSRLEKLSWKPETPGRLPAGARISAGKSGRVEMSFPTMGEVLVNCLPVSFMPSPESPAKRMVTGSASSSMEEDTPELQLRPYPVCCLLLDKKNVYLH